MSRRLQETWKKKIVQNFGYGHAHIYLIWLFLLFNSSVTDVSFVNVTCTLRSEVIILVFIMIYLNQNSYKGLHVHAEADKQIWRLRSRTKFGATVERWILAVVMLTTSTSNTTSEPTNQVLSYDLQINMNGNCTNVHL